MEISGTVYGIIGIMRRMTQLKRKTSIKVVSLNFCGARSVFQYSDQARNDF
jgi:uncharacterized protein with ACT and thioredoxin-like domain